MWLFYIDYLFIELPETCFIVIYILIEILKDLYRDRRNSPYCPAELCTCLTLTLFQTRLDVFFTIVNYWSTYLNTWLPKMHIHGTCYIL